MNLDTLLPALAAEALALVPSSIPPPPGTLPSLRPIKPIPTLTHITINERSLDTLPLSPCSRIVSVYHFDPSTEIWKRTTRILELAGANHPLPQRLTSQPFLHRSFAVIPPPAPGAEFQISTALGRVEKTPASELRSGEVKAAVEWSPEEMEMNEAPEDEEEVQMNTASTVDLPLPVEPEVDADVQREAERRVWEEEMAWTRLEAGMCVMEAVKDAMTRLGAVMIPKLAQVTRSPRKKGERRRRKPADSEEIGMPLVVHLGGAAWEMKGTPGEDFEFLTLEKFLLIVDAVGQIEASASTSGAGPSGTS